MPIFAQRTMPNQIPEIAFLLKEVERKYGREVHTSTDFESLSVVIERDINEYISSAQACERSRSGPVCALPVSLKSFLEEFP